MPKLRKLAGHDILTILQGFGFQQVSQRGSHVKLVRETTGTRQVLTVPLHKLTKAGKIVGSVLALALLYLFGC